MCSEKLSQLGVWLLGIALVIAPLKTSSPYEATATLAALGVAKSVGVSMTLALAAVEAGVGGILLAFPKARLSLIAGAATALFLLAGRVTIHVAGVSGCGCFGPVQLPGWLVVSVLLGGAVSCIVRLARGQGEGFWRSWRKPIRRTVLLAGLTIGLVASTWAGAPRSADPIARLVRMLDLPRDKIERALVVIGSWSCKHCVEAIGELHKAVVARDWASQMGQYGAPYTFVFHVPGELRAKVTPKIRETQNLLRKTYLSFMGFRVQHGRWPRTLQELKLSKTSPPLTDAFGHPFSFFQPRSQSVFAATSKAVQNKRWILLAGGIVKELRENAFQELHLPEKLR